jgi:lysophospholipase L1-like esterase
MNTRASRISILALIAFGAAFVFAQAPAGGQHWAATWAASPQQPRALQPPRPPAAAAPAAGVAVLGAAPAPPVSSFSNQTLRMIVRTSIGGNRVRVHLSNDFGTAPLTIGAAHIALRDKESAIVQGSDRPLLFSGKPSCTIPAGAQMLSDPVDLNVPALGDVAISVYVPGETGPATQHATGLHTSYISKTGDFTSASAFTEPATTQSWYLVAGIDVMASADAAAIVAFGDSITDGATSTPDTNRSWPSLLAERLQANPATKNLAIVNQGISGNRVLRDGAGVSALARFDRDVLSQAGVKWVVIMESINDIGIGFREGSAPIDSVTADDLIGGLRQMIARAHTHGIKVIGATLTPYQGAAYYTDKGEEVRMAINQWIRTGGEFDYVVDFDAATRDAANAKTFRADYNIRDHLHPNDAGYKAMADAIDLSWFAPAKAGSGSGSAR